MVRGEHLTAERHGPLPLTRLAQHHCQAGDAELGGGGDSIGLAEVERGQVGLLGAGIVPGMFQGVG